MQKLPLRASLLFMLALLCFFQIAGSAENQGYGVKVDYSDGRIKKFPDFSLRFLGQRHMASEHFSLGFTFYDFEAKADGELKTVSWSSGTGDIGPTYFEIAGRSFVLELSASLLFDGFLKNGEMLVWKKKKYEQLLQKDR